MALLLGMNRGRCSLLTSEGLEGEQARELGIVNDVVPMADILDCES